MAKVVKTVRIEESLVERMGEIAMSEFDGNATAALEEFIKQAVELRKIPEAARWAIYSKSNQAMLDSMGVKRGSKDELEALKALTAALCI